MDPIALFKEISIIVISFSYHDKVGVARYKYPERFNLNKIKFYLIFLN
ncbi:hypothetical protein PROSTU_00261 [Providencia stuartii ATCC 25827]|uniref:Uncharacterized protein n=1 Tax=Providencia stuartii ATCC 25827 TaxID=471874 RepID=A0AA87CV44_PROST|nr:hypothetical protein PROSTU_00261 [Providencia stuartii ATCC 25827]